MKRALGVWLLIGSLACADQEWIVPQSAPSPQENPATTERVELGRLLFFDKRLSRDASISCATCHDPAKGWSDALPKARGVEGRTGTRNTPTLINSGFNRRHFWDGRAESLEDQALGPIEAEAEMDMKIEALVERLGGIKGYVRLFDAAYPSEGISARTIAAALSAFERTLISRDTPFDRFIKGERAALSAEAQHGFELFRGKAGCVVCHEGFNFTDGSYHNIALGDGDEGRYRLKPRSAWYHAFKTPTLREVSRSAPYFHDGSVKTLHEAAAICGSGGRFGDDPKKSSFMVDHGLSKEEIAHLVAFLQTLEAPLRRGIEPTEFPR